MDRNALYLRRRGSVLLPASAHTGEPLPLQYVASVVKNVEALGYGFTERLIAACRALSLEQLVALNRELIDLLTRSKGAHRSFTPMYPNFPAQVMEMREGELYLNALVHYWSGGRLFPVTKTRERFPLIENVELTPLDLGTEAEFTGLFAQIAGANTSLSDQDKDDLRTFVSAYGDGIGALLPDAVPQKENMAFLAGLLLQHTTHAADFIQRFCRTATDLLRLAVALSGGDVSLATNTKFRTFTRPERVLLLTLLERQANATEDMLRHRNRWIRLGEKLHPGEYATRFPMAAQAFTVLRDDLPFTTFNGAVEKALTTRNVPKALGCLEKRPGDLARRLDHLLRTDGSLQDTVTAAFAEGAAKVSTPVLLQVMHHFRVRNDTASLRVFFPKGNVAKAQGIANELPALPDTVCARVVAICQQTLRERFRALPPLGRTYVDPALANYPVPFAMRSASRSLRALVRGSKLPLPACTVLRFFVWWKNGDDTVDIDLSAVLFDEKFVYADVLSYYNLKGFGGCHSGDIVDAPEGASEFIDITREKVRAKGVRYVVMSVNSYSQQPFTELPECFAGWMAREHPESGEIYEPKTVRDRIDLTADTRIAIPLVIDLVENQVIWCDMGLRRHPGWQNNVAGNLSGVQLTLQALVDLRKPNLYELLSLHAEARGESVTTAAEADTVFSVANETPFQIEKIASEYMA